jgi:hypothetical protein
LLRQAEGRRDQGFRFLHPDKSLGIPVRSFGSEDHQLIPQDAVPMRFSTSRKKLVRRVRYSTDLNNVANNQLAASSGFHLTINPNFTALDQQFRLTARICNATEF